ncbi:MULTISPECIES: imidazole glycerol phosphate synthase subunit HisH [Spirulina sp. CCY15215]|uniref:imidazole glycerol phosphate synthase subunit HisH n=1 Tax=Spirulina sp. CCY15215 TaxID=2767591 RepID=UPI00194F55CB
MTQKKVLIIDYGMGNLQSVKNALEFLGYSATVSDCQDDIPHFDAYILPGVGAFGEAMENLRQRDLIDILSEGVLHEKKPFLGICLGMQLLAESSVEMCYSEGLNWIPGHVIKIEVEEGIRLPHVGWNAIEIVKPVPLFNRIDSYSSYYFDHSYQLICDNRYVIAKCQYGREIISAIQCDNIFATQFHPEKSQVKGLRLLRNFLNYVESS